MNYYYDVLLNFQEDYYMFYEWDNDDTLEYIKKIPLYHISKEKYKTIYTKKIKISNEFLSEIENKTKLKKGKTLLYAAIFSDGKSAIALEFNNDGEVINKSSLLLEDEINICEFMYTLDEEEFDFEIIQNENFKKETRQEEKIKKLLKLEIDSMYKAKNNSKLKYIYLEWFDEYIDNIDLIYKKMINRLDKKLTKKEYEIYELIKITYNV